MIAAETTGVTAEIVDGGLPRHRFVDYIREYELLVDESGLEPPSAEAAEWSEAIRIESYELKLNCDSNPIRLISSGVSIEPWDPATGERS